MKIAFTLAALLVLNFAYSQSTTEIEYNYMKKGFRQVQEAGLDVKAGYTVEQLPSQNFTDITGEFWLLRRSNNTIAGVIVKTTGLSDFGSGVNYYAIPAVNMNSAKSFGWTQFYEDYETMTGGQKKLIFRWLSYQYAYYLSKAGGK